MQPYQEYQQQSQDQGQSTPSQPSLEPTSKASQPPEGTYQPTIQEPPPYQQVYPGQGGQPLYQQPYPPPVYSQAYPGYAGAYPMFGRKDWLLTLLLCLFLGWFGAHRFYTGHILIGVIQLLTFGGCGVWTIVDLVLILTDNYRDANGYPLVKP